MRSLQATTSHFTFVHAYVVCGRFCNRLDGVLIRTRPNSKLHRRLLQGQKIRVSLADTAHVDVSRLGQPCSSTRGRRHKPTLGSCSASSNPRFLLLLLLSVPSL